MATELKILLPLFLTVKCKSIKQFQLMHLPVANSMNTSLAISGLLQAAKVTTVEIRGLCYHGNVSNMAKNYRLSCQGTQHTSATLKIAENEVLMVSMDSFLLK